MDIIFDNGNGDHTYIKFPDIQNNIFEVLRMDVSLDKVDRACDDTMTIKQDIIIKPTHYIFLACC